VLPRSSQSQHHTCEMPWIRTSLWLGWAYSTFPTVFTSGAGSATGRQAAPSTVGCCATTPVAPTVAVAAAAATFGISVLAGIVSGKETTVPAAYFSGWQRLSWSSNLYLNMVWWTEFHQDAINWQQSRLMIRRRWWPPPQHHHPRTHTRTQHPSFIVLTTSKSENRKALEWTKRDNTHCLLVLFPRPWFCNSGLFTLNDLCSRALPIESSRVVQLQLWIDIGMELVLLLCGGPTAIPTPEPPPVINYKAYPSHSAKPQNRSCLGPLVCAVLILTPAKYLLERPRTPIDITTPKWRCQAIVCTLLLKSTWWPKQFSPHVKSLCYLSLFWDVADGTLRFP
jgi:hypothetical protein